MAGNPSRSAGSQSSLSSSVLPSPSRLPSSACSSSQERGNADRCWSGANVTSTDSPASSVRVIASPFGMSVMSLSFCPVPGARQSGHGQLSRSHTAGNRAGRPPMVSSRSAPMPVSRNLEVDYTRVVASRTRVVIAGGGVLGTMHAVMARRRRFEVVHLEREAEARGASVRNFGLVWVSGRKSGPELSLALRARELWAELGALVPGIGFRAAGSLTLASGDAELALLKEAAALPDADRREFELLDPAAVRAVNPALRGEFAGGLYCRADAIVEPRRVLPALRGYLAGDRYEWLPGREVTEIAA